MGQPQQKRPRKKTRSNASAGPPRRRTAATVEVVTPRGLVAPRGYSHGILARGGFLLFVAGQVAWDRQGRIVSDRFARQFDQALGNLLQVVRHAGGTPGSVVKLTIFVGDVAEYLAALAEVGRAYRRRMDRHFPAMSLVEVKAFLEPGARVEIEGVAVI